MFKVKGGNRGIFTVDSLGIHTGLPLRGSLRRKTETRIGQGLFLGSALKTLFKMIPVK